MGLGAVAVKTGSEQGMTTRFRAAVELRDGAGDSPGRLTGTLMRYGSPGQHGREVFAPGALRWPDNGIRIDLEHASSPARGSVQPPILRAVPTVDGGEVRIDAPLPNTTAARDLAELMRADPPVYSGLSVEFHSVREHRAGGQRVITEARLDGGALTDDPAYPDTGVEVRTAASDRPPLRGIWAWL